MKTQTTLDIEAALVKSCFAKNESLAKAYGCLEVRAGFDGRRIPNTLTTEYVDFITFNKSTQIFRCYEIKVSLEDLQSENALTFYGHYNYLVVTAELYEQIKDCVYQYVPDHVGITVFERGRLSVKKKPKKQDISAEQADILKDSMIRSLFYKAYGTSRAHDMFRARLKEEGRKR